MNNDLISREALKEDLFIKFGNQLPNGLFDEINNAPTVEVDNEFIDKIRATGNFKNGYQLAKNYYKRPHGEWIERTDTEWHFECNQCKGLSPWKAQFCGVCGADMRGGAE